MPNNIYQYWCITEKKNINELIDINNPYPTVCKNGDDHIVDWSSLSIDYEDTSAGINHGSLDGLTDDDHYQYLNINGRNNGQIVYGGNSPKNNLVLKSTSDNTKGRIILDDKTTINNIYPTLSDLSIQNNGNITNIELLNNGGPEKGGLISMKDSDLEIHNNQGGNIKLYSNGNENFTMKKDGTFRIHNLESGILKSDIHGNIVSVDEGSAFNKNFGNTTNTVAEGNHTHLASSITMGTFDNQRISQSNVKQHESILDHDKLTNYIFNKHIDHSLISIEAGVGLKGGGTIDSNRKLSIDINSLETNLNPDGSINYLMTYNVADGSHNKILINDLPISDSIWSKEIDNVYRQLGKVSIGSNTYGDARVKITGYGYDNNNDNDNPWLYLEGGSGIDDGQIIFGKSSSTKGSLMKLQGYNNPSRIEFIQIGSGSLEKPEFKTWFGMSNALSTDMELFNGNFGIGKRPTVALDVLGNANISGLINDRNIKSDGNKLDLHISSISNVHGVNSNLVGISDVQTLTNKTIDATKNKITGVISVSKVFDSYYNGNKEVLFTGNWTDVPLEITRASDDYFTHIEGSSEVTINVSHRYKIESRCTTMLDKKSNCQTMSTLFINDGSNSNSDFDEIDGSSAYMENRTGSQSYNTGCVTVILNLKVGTKIKMMAIRTAGNGTVSLVPDGCSLTIMTI